MGNANGKPDGKLGLSAVASVCTVEKNHLLFFAKRFAKSESETITNQDLVGAIEATKGLEDVDKELLQKIYIMFDVNGDETVNYKDFLAGLCPLVTGTAKEKLSLAFTLWDLSRRSGGVNRAELRRIAMAINNVASYFGDPMVKEKDIGYLVKDIFQMQPSSASVIKINDYFEQIYDHGAVHTFLNAKGTVKYAKPE